MIRQQFHIAELDWQVYVYYSVDRYYAEEILRRMRRIGCSEKMLEEAGANMKSGRMDTGVTYSNYLYRTAVMVIGRASSDRQFFNSFMHEMRHMEDDLGNMNGIEHDGEEIAYLSGHIAEQVFDYVKLFLCDCDCCKEEIKKRIGYETG